MMYMMVSNIKALSEKFRKIIENKIFEWIIISIIILSALIVGIKTYEVDIYFKFIIEWLDIVVTLFFLTEIIVRILAEGSLKRFFQKGWNVFDFIIVSLSLIPVSESDLALLGRLLRVFRVLRLISFIPELKVLLNAFFKAIPRISYISLLMFIIFYIYGAMGNMFFEQVNGALWGDIGASMLTLFQIATFENWSDIMYETMEIYPLSWLYFLSFIFMIAFIFLNMMIGSILETMQEEHQAIDPNFCNPKTPEYHKLVEQIQTLQDTVQKYIVKEENKAISEQKLDVIYQKILSVEQHYQSVNIISPIAKPSLTSQTELKQKVIMRHQQGESWAAIAEDLNQQAIATPSGKGKWHANTLAKWVKK